ncbi:MAG: NAD-dependent epimerase/dehydratase family protein [Gammaproteobacteria bacterium]|nr:NAD-dependent epimerase/dehydratase family protein [Gammaproteobacteria bacterium]
MKTVLVTGATGALGLAVTQYLNKREEYKVVTTGRSGENVDFQLDVIDKVQLASIIDQVKPALILHLAATFTHDFDDAYAVNVEASRQLLEIVQCSKLAARVILIGSAAEYGVVQANESPIREDHVLNPVSVYGLTKAWQTQLAGFYSKRGVDVVVARVFNLKGENLSDRLFIGRLRKQIDEVLSGDKSTIELGPLSATRDYLSTQDAAQQIFSIAEHGKSGSVYHVASGKPIVMRELLLQTLEEHNLDDSIVKEATENFNRSGYDVPVIYADISRVLQLMDN